MASANEFGLILLSLVRKQMKIRNAERAATAVSLISTNGRKSCQNKVLSASCLSAESVVYGIDSSQLSSTVRIFFDLAVHFQHFVTFRLS
jgi:hypothetical protein